MSQYEREPVSGHEPVSGRPAALAGGASHLCVAPCELIHSTTHLMEIDLLHYGEHTVFAPRPALEGHKKWDYVVCLHKGGWSDGNAWVWLVSPQERLPRVIVPLLEGDPDVVVDLQSVLNQVYQQGRYGVVLNYGADPPAALSEEDTAWLDGVLKEKGLR